MQMVGGKKYPYTAKGKKAAAKAKNKAKPKSKKRGRKWQNEIPNLQEQG